MYKTKPNILDSENLGEPRVAAQSTVQEPEKVKFTLTRAYIAIVVVTVPPNNNTVRQNNSIIILHQTYFVCEY